MNRKNLAPRHLFNSQVFAFNQGVLVEEGRKTLFISGQLAMDLAGNFQSDLNFSQQCKRAFEGIDAVLAEAGASRRNIVKIVGFVTDMQTSIQEFTRTAKEFFKDGDYPASTLIQVGALAFPKQLVEVEATAVI